ncbi:MAG TPA: tetratricopeptide repeat protein [bacterium]|nr:tetratricopeptide repeat protein [bacterium]
MRSRLFITMSIVFIAGFGYALWFAVPFFGWGSGPEMGYGVATLQKVSFFGYPLPQMIGSLFSSVPVSSVEFATGTAGALLVALDVSLIFYGCYLLTGSMVAGVGASILTALSVDFVQAVGRYDSGAWTIFLACLVFVLISSFAKNGKIRTLNMLVFVLAIGAFHNGYIFVAGTASLVYVLLKKDSKIGIKAFLIPSIFIVFVAVTLLVFQILRSPLLIDWKIQLAPWAGIYSPMGNMLEMVFGGIDKSMMPFRALELVKSLSGAFIPVLALAAVGEVFNPGKLEKASLSVWILFFVAMVFCVCSTGAEMGIYLSLVAIFLCIKGAQGAVNIARKIINGIDYRVSVATAFFIAASIFYVFSINNSELDDLRGQGGRAYFDTVLKTLKRDSVLLVDTKVDQMYGFNYMKDVKKIRKDITYIYPEYLTGQDYRRFVFSQSDSKYLVPTDEQYEGMLKQIAGIMPNLSEGSVTRNIRMRIMDGLVSTLTENVLFRTHVNRPVYFTRIDSVTNSKFYQLMMFYPEGFVFELRSENKVFTVDELLKESSDIMLDDPIVNKLIAIYYENIAENFFTKENYGPAALLLEEGVKIDPECESCRFFLGLIYKKWGDYKRAELELSEVIKLLDAKKMRGRQENVDIFMYYRIFNELNMPEKAKEYQRIIEPGGGAVPVQGIKRP